MRHFVLEPDQQRGAKQLIGWQDNQLGAACQFLLLADGSLRCVPTLAGMPESVSGYFADSRCTEKLGLLSSPSACGTPQYDYEYSTSSTCSPEYGSEGYRLFHAGAQFTGQLYFLSGSTCTAVAAASTFAYWQVGAEVDYTQFVSGSIATE